MTGFGYFIWSCEVVLKNKPTFFPKRVYFISFLVFSTSIMLALAGGGRWNNIKNKPKWVITFWH